jgi:hypothetical protein
MLRTDERLRQLHNLQIIGECREQALGQLTREHALMENSRSWRITAPLRAFFRRWDAGKRFVMRVARAVSRKSRLGPVAARLAPGLHARVRSRLSPPGAVH